MRRKSDTASHDRQLQRGGVLDVPKRPDQSVRAGILGGRPREQRQGVVLCRVSAGLDENHLLRSPAAEKPSEIPIPVGVTKGARLATLRIRGLTFVLR